MSVLALASFATLGMAPSAFSEEIYYSNEDGADIFVENCVGADFTVTIDDTEYAPGDVASGFSLGSDFSVSAGHGVTVGWVTVSLVQGSYGHGAARVPLEGPGSLDVSDVIDGDWLTLNENAVELNFPFSPSIFYADCPGGERYAYIQTFPGLSLEDAGFDANLVDGVYLSDQEQLDSLGLPSSEVSESGLLFAPMSNFRNPAYAFWVNYLESFYLNNPAARFSFETPLEGDFVQGVWAYLFVGGEFASTFYSYSDGSELAESAIDDVFEEAVTPAPAAAAPAAAAPATTATTSPTLATTGANVEWLIVSGLLAGMAGSGFLALSRRKRIW